MKDGASNTQTIPNCRRKISFGGQPGVDKPDAMKRESVSTLNLHTQQTQGRNSFGHDAFAAGLVDRRSSLICEEHLEAMLTSRDRSGKSDGAAADND
jgi:hypothetical protein